MHLQKCLTFGVHISFFLCKGEKAYTWILSLIAIAVLSS